MKRIFAITALSLALSGCGRGQATLANGSVQAASRDAGERLSPAARTEQDEVLWSRAKEGEPDELARLAHREGPMGLVERGAQVEWRKTAVMALAYADASSNPWVALPWLAEVADGSDAEEARLAVETTAALAARPRRAVDPEDALELRAGCERLAAIAKSAQKPTPVRVGAVRTLRMLADYGCAPPEASPAAGQARDR